MGCEITEYVMDPVYLLAVAVFAVSRTRIMR